MPVFWELLKRWPDEHCLARADIVELTDLLQPIGLHNIRAKRLVSMAQTMVEIPYDESNMFKSRDRTAPDTPIGIYPGVGRYAIDSWRIFVAGGGASVGLRGAKPVSPFDTDSMEAAASETQLASALPLMPRNGEAKEAEWKAVMPLDKELRAYLVWRWAKEGQVWDPVRGVVSTPRGSH
ncbi:ENDO3c domain-containing protein [Pseudozyma hubeiensis]|nr:ENDO3c domain-containing protein [Pseudozyma hubeiensis]